MGWAKYLEDDMSIYNNRIYLRERTVKQLVVCKPCPSVIKVQVKDNVAAAHKDVQRSDESFGIRTRVKRIGLEVRFPFCPDKTLVSKLRLNGWWWSNSANSWCNADSEANRRYAKETLKKWNPIVLKSECV